ncbi:MAG: fatty acid desaturase [Marinobacter psychrophilus]
MFKYPADRLSVTLILILSFVDFTLYFFVDTTWVLGLFWLIMILPKGVICSWNHHHQHTLTFKNKGFNRILEFFYALHTGVTTNLWVLHHVLGHHKNYLDQAEDESSWQRGSGKTMGEIEYTLNIAGTAYLRGYQVGRNFPRQQKKFLIYTSITFVILALLVLYKPMSALLLFVLPMICGLLLTAWTTFEHHSNLETDNKFEASRNNLNRFYNLVTGNLGYHTAHHYKQGVHWSVLPELHEKIKDKIPPHLIYNSLW